MHTTHTKSEKKLVPLQKGIRIKQNKAGGEAILHAASGDTHNIDI